MKTNTLEIIEDKIPEHLEVTGINPRVIEETKQQLLTIIDEINKIDGENISIETLEDMILNGKIIFTNANISRYNNPEHKYIVTLSIEIPSYIKELENEHKWYIVIEANPTKKEETENSFSITIGWKNHELDNNSAIVSEITKIKPVRYLKNKNWEWSKWTWVVNSYPKIDSQE